MLEIDVLPSNGISIKKLYFSFCKVSYCTRVNNGLLFYNIHNKVKCKNKILKEK